MCPFCLASIGLVVASATSAGGLTALAVKLSQKKNPGQEVAANSSESSTAWDVTLCFRGLNERRFEKGEQS
jgi:hypothetical protein